MGPRLLSNSSPCVGKWLPVKLAQLEWHVIQQNTATVHLGSSEAQLEEVKQLWYLLEHWFDERQSPGSICGKFKLEHPPHTSFIHNFWSCPHRVSCPWFSFWIKCGDHLESSDIDSGMGPWDSAWWQLPGDGTLIWKPCLLQRESVEEAWRINTPRKGTRQEGRFLSPTQNYLVWSSGWRPSTLCCNMSSRWPKYSPF